MGSDAIFDYYLVRVSLEAKIVRHLNGQIFYQYLSNKSQISPVVQDNQFGFKLDLSY